MGRSGIWSVRVPGFGSADIGAVSDPPMTLTATTGAPGATVTLQQLTHSVPTMIDWGDGSGPDAIAAGTVVPIQHVYAAAGTYAVTIARARWITHLDLQDAKIGGLNTAELRQSTYIDRFYVTAITGSTINSADMAGWTPTDWRLYFMPAGTYAIDSADMAGWTPTTWYLYSMPAGTYAIDSADMAGWTPTFWRLSSMPAGTYAIDSADMAGWTPTDWRLFSMPAASTTWTIAANDFAGWLPTTVFYCHDNALNQAQVNALLWGMYQAAATPRTGAGGTILVGGTNAAPSGVFQPCAACPVNVATPGKEVAHELLNDGCGVGFNVWATVTTS